MVEAHFMSDAMPRRLFLFLLVLPVTMRLFALVLASDVPHIGDPTNYLRLAESLGSGRGLALPRTEHASWTLTATFPPGLPFLLAGISLVFPLGTITLCFLNSLIDIAAALLLGRLALQLGRRDLATPVAFAYLLWPSIALMAPLAYKENLFVALLLASLVALLEHVRHGGTRWAVASGIAAGGVILTQPAATPFLALAFIALKPMFGPRDHWLRASLIAAATAVLVMLPWWVRNAIAFDTFIPLTTSGGLALWQGAHPAGGMSYQPLPATWTASAELAVSQRAQSAAWQIIISDPLGYVQRCLAKFPTSLVMTNWAVDQLVLAKGQPFPGLAQSASLRLGPAVAELGVIVLAIIGLFRFPRVLQARLLWACFVQVIAFGIWFEFSERHRAFMIPFVILMAATLLTASFKEVTIGKKSRG